MATYSRQRRRGQAPRERLQSRPGFTPIPAPQGYYPNDYSGIAIEGGYESPPASLPYLPVQQGGKLNGGVDQHAWLYTPATITAPPQGPRKTGRVDPLEDGPTHDDLRHLRMYQRRMVGTSTTRFQDRPDYGPAQPGRQDGVSWTYYGSPTRALQPYDPALCDESGQMPDTWVAIPPASARGWAAIPAVQEQEKINSKGRATRQQRPPHQDRLANSSYAGQSYSAQTKHVAQRGSASATAYVGPPGGMGVPGAHA